jgi:branched-chain amino acid transport system substrate-binding protein
MVRRWFSAALITFLTTAAALAADAPAEIKLGTLYASSGRFASISMPVHYGLKLWMEQKNAEGGVYVKAFDKKIPLKLVVYDDQSSTATAATLYNQLITQDKVDILISDSGSVLTSVAVPIARDHKMFLIDQTGTGANFFTADNPYIALIADPVSSIWPKPLADFLTQDGPPLGIKRVAVLYATNDFTGTQASAVRKFIKESNSGVEIVFDQGVPTETSNYTVLLNNIRASNPDAVIHLGYAPNDIAFLRNVQDSGIKFKLLFCVYPGIETELLEKNLGSKALNYVFTYVPSSQIAYETNFGMSLKEYTPNGTRSTPTPRSSSVSIRWRATPPGWCWKRRWRRRRASSSLNCVGRCSAFRASSRRWTARSSSIRPAPRSAKSRRWGSSSSTSTIT